MKKLAPLIALSALVLTLVVCFLLQPENNGDAVAQSDFPELPDLNGFAPHEGIEIEPETSDFTRRADEAIKRATTAQAAAKAVGPANLQPIPRLDPDSARVRLAHRPHPLTPAQNAALSRLRWNNPGKNVTWRSAKEKPVITFLRGARLQPAAEEPAEGLSLAATTARNFLHDWEDALAVGPGGDSWELRSETTDELGYTQIRFDQRWKGLEVWPGGIMVQTAKHGNVTLMTATYAPEPNGLDRKPTLTEAQAARAARAAATIIAPRITGPELLVHAPLEAAGPSLAYRVTVESSPIDIAHVFVDAHSGDILDRVALVHSANAVGSGTDLEGVSRPLNLWRANDGTHYVIDTSKQMYDPTSQPPNLENSRGVIAITDLRNSMNINGEVFQVTSASPNGPWDPHAASAAFSLSQVYDYYLARFARNSVDGMGGTMVGKVNLDALNAFSNSQNQSMIFGNRDSFAAALDVVAHEMTHSVISTTSNLIYQFQSGALNESFADILGEGCEAHFTGGAPDWLLGTLLETPGRSLSDPPSIVSGGTGRPFPNRMSLFEVLPGSADAGGVHINSSITNFAFYQLAEGLPGAIGIDDALQIFYRAVTTKLNPNSQFIDARLSCVESARELFGSASAQAQMTGEAFDSIELFDQAPIPPPAPLPTVDALDSTLFIFPASGFTFLGRREASFNDNNAGVFLGDGGQGTPVRPFAKPAVVGDGGRALIVTADNDAAFVDTLTGVDSPFGLSGRISAVATSADGTVQAYGLLADDGSPGKRILVFDTKTQESVTYTAREFVTTPNESSEGAGASDNAIVLVDALEVSADGSVVFYDAINRLSLPDGGNTEVWSMYAIVRAANLIVPIIPPVPNFNLGNPSVSQVRPNNFTFDVTEIATGRNTIMAGSIGNFRQLRLLAAGSPSDPGWPGYSGDDQAVVYTNYQFNPNSGFFEPYLESQPVESDGQTPRGAPFTWLTGSFPQIGTIYRRGTYHPIPTVSVAAFNASATEGGDSGVFRLTHTGSTEGPLPVTFLLTGSAAHGSDYARIPLSASIPAGSNFFDISVTPIDDTSIEGQESVTLSLTSNAGYAIGQSSATIMIEDNPDNAGDSFANWAAARGIGANDLLGDRNQDGRPHLLDYALGSEPITANPSLAVPHLAIDNDRATLVVERTSKRPDLDYSVEISGDGNTWRSGAGHTTTIEDSDTRLRVRADSPVSTTRELLFRLRITQRP